MPFIWDDFEWLLVDDEETYDKNRFVVTRKLSVKPKTDKLVCTKLNNLNCLQKARCSFIFFLILL